MKENANLPKETIPIIPEFELNEDEDALTILYKFQQLHHFNIFNTRRNVQNINSVKAKPTEEVQYIEILKKNQEIGKGLLATKKKFREKLSGKIDPILNSLTEKKLKNVRSLPILSNYDESKQTSRIFFQQLKDSQKSIEEPKKEFNSKQKKKIVSPVPLTFSKP